jgi:hypothetical protein
VKESRVEWFLLFVSISLAAWLIFRIKAWYCEDEDHTAETHEMIEHITELEREGDLSQEEFRKIKGRLKIQNEGGVDSEDIGDSTHQVG